MKYVVNGREVTRAEFLAGGGERLETMLASRQAPRLITDDTFFAGAKQGEQFADRPDFGDYYARELRRQGGSPRGKKYLSGLARYPGDPEAWVSSRAEVKEVCRRRGWSCSGQVTVKQNPESRPDPENAEGYTVADDIVEREVTRQIEGNPELAGQRDELFAETRDRLSGGE